MFIISPTASTGTHAMRTKPNFHDASSATERPNTSDPNVCTALPKDFPVALCTALVSVRKLDVSAPTEFAGSSKKPTSWRNIARNKCTRRRVVSLSPMMPKIPPCVPETIHEKNAMPANIPAKMYAHL
eukprot:31240-Pelagococcus_subviridis.AAC.7